MPDRSTLRIFISSPADVRAERLKAERIVARLDREFAYHFHVEPVLWEREPLVASHHFQDPENIPEPRTADIVVVILWSVLGVPLPADRFVGALSRRPVTGTEWEFEDALAGAREHGVPALLLYRKTASITADLSDDAVVDERRAQRTLVQDFIGRWFRADSGPGYTAASHSFAATAEFEEKLYDHLHALLARRAGGAAPGIAIRWPDAPFRALLSYEYEHAEVFFGRTRARNELRELLAARIAHGSAFVLVYGASGSGKSSLVKAGLLFDLALPGMIGRVGLVRRAAMRPSDHGGHALASLAAAILSPTALPELTALEYSHSRLAALLREAPGHAELPIRQGLAHAARAAQLTDIAEARLALVVDQLEELFTDDRQDEGEREAFVAALATLAESGLVWVIATMRSDFLDRLETPPGLSLARLAVNEACYRLLPPDAAEIGQIIRQPAAEAGLRFAHHPVRGVGLDEVIRDDATRESGALPLLSFLLDKLWDKRSDAGVLTVEAYEALGRLDGVIRDHAEKVCAALGPESAPALAAVLLALVTAEARPGDAGRGAAPAVFVTRPAPRAEVATPPERARIVDALIDARLVVSTHGDSGPVLRLAHEALIQRWPRLADLARDERNFIELRDRLQREAGLWRAHPSGSREAEDYVVPDGARLREAVALLGERTAVLDPEIVAYIRASAAAAAERRRKASEAEAEHRQERLSWLRRHERRGRAIVIIMIVLAVLLVLSLLGVG